MNRWKPRQVLGVRQSSGALAMDASQTKAPVDWRSPRRYRAIRGFMVPTRTRSSGLSVNHTFFLEVEDVDVKDDDPSD